MPNAFVKNATKVVSTVNAAVTTANSTRFSGAEGWIHGGAGIIFLVCAVIAMLTKDSIATIIAVVIAAIYLAPHIGTIGLALLAR